MLVNLPFLLFALILLWIPRQWMRMGFSILNQHSHRREPSAPTSAEPWKAREPGDPAVGIAEEFSKPRNYVDLFRGAVGGLAVMGGLGIAPCLSPGAGASRSVEQALLAVQLGILLVGLLVQTVRHERQRFLFFAPIFFLFGLSVGLCGLKGALFAFAMVWAIHPMVRNPEGFLTVYAVLMGLFGGFFLGFGNPLAIAAAGLCFLPVVLSLLAQRPLVVFSRKPVRTGGTTM